MRRLVLGALALGLSGCGSLLPDAGGPSTVQLVAGTDRLTRNLSGNVLVREAGQTTVTDFSLTAKAGVQQRQVYAGSQGTTVDVCVQDAASKTKLAGLRFKLSKAEHLVLLQDDGAGVTLQADVAGEPSPRASCNSLE